MTERGPAPATTAVDADLASSEADWQALVAEAEHERRLRRRAWCILALAFALAAYVALRLSTPSRDEAAPAAPAREPAIEPSKPPQRAALLLPAVLTDAIPDAMASIAVECPAVRAPEAREARAPVRVRSAKPRAPATHRTDPPAPQQHAANAAAPPKPDFNWVYPYAP